MNGKTPIRVRQLLQEMIADLGSINKVVKKTGITHNTIGTWLEGRSEPELDSLKKLSDATGKSIAWLRDDLQLEAKSTRIWPEDGTARMIPLVSDVSAGQSSGIEWEDAYPTGRGMEMVACPPYLDDPKGYALRVHGDSMTPKYSEGMIVFVTTNTEPVNNDYVIAKLKNGEILLKRLRLTNGTVLLESINPAFDTIIVQRQDIISLSKIVGSQEK